MAGQSDKASTVRALVRGTRTALIVQLLVAALALAATVFALIETRALEQRREQLEAETQELENLRDGLRVANQQASAGYRRWQNWLTTGDKRSLELAEEAFVSASENAPYDPILRDQIAQILSAQGNAAGAVAAGAEALSLAKDEAGEGGEVAVSYYARLAVYQCAAGQQEQARATLSEAGEALAAANEELRGQLAQRCGAVLASAPSSARADQMQPSGAETSDAFKVRLVFLHIRDEADRADAQRLGEALSQRGYRVRRIELVGPPRGYRESLRYYYPQQAGEASAIGGEIAAIANEIGVTGWSGWRPQLVSLEGAYENLPRDRVEVWLPSRVGE
jgi:FtsZ-binding cell division protein ZapB